jgi:predicted aldo/keto reductase-like oxidoreductase
MRENRERGETSVPATPGDATGTAAGPGGSELTRRGFLAATAAGALAGCSGEQVAEPPRDDARAAIEETDIFTPPPTVEHRDGMPYRVFGKTGEKVSILGVGGYHVGVQATPDDSVAIIRTAIDSGINFLDNAWEYHNGRSEERMGLALRGGYREKVFLMTKVCGRDARTAMSNLEESLRRLRTDVIDLWQFHECNYDNDPDWIFAADGAIHAAIKAREQQKVRFIGFTGHKSPHIHLKMLEQEFDWDALQCPLNVMDAHYRSFATQVLPVALARNLGIVGMKPLGGDGKIPGDGGVTVEECLRYSFSLHIPVCLSGMKTLQELRENIAVAKRFRPLAPEERLALLERVRLIAGDGRLERFKSTQVFDSDVHQKQHGFG